MHNEEIRQSAGGETELSEADLTRLIEEQEKNLQQMRREPWPSEVFDREEAGLRKLQARLHEIRSLKKAA